MDLNRRAEIVLEVCAERFKAWGRDINNLDTDTRALLYACCATTATRCAEQAEAALDKSEKMVARLERIEKAAIFTHAYLEEFCHGQEHHGKQIPQNGIEDLVDELDAALDAEGGKSEPGE